MRSTRAVAFAVLIAAAVHVMAVRAQDYPLCATGALDPTVTDVVWANFETANGTLYTQFLALNTSTADVLCLVSSAPGYPHISPGIAYGNGGVFTLIAPDPNNPQIPNLYRVDTYDFSAQPAQLCVLPADLTPAGVWTTDTSAPNQAPELLLLAQTNENPVFDVYTIDWTHSPSPTASCPLTRVASLDGRAAQIVYAGPGAVDWSARVLYAVMMSANAANDSAYVASWALDGTGTTTLSAITFTPPTPYPNAAYLIELLALAPVSGPNQPQTLYAGWEDVNDADPNFYWGTATLDTTAGGGTARLNEMFVWPPNWLAPSGGMSPVIWNAALQQWQMSIVGFSAEGVQLTWRMFHVNPVNGAVQMSPPVPLQFGADAVVLRPAYPKA